MLPPLNRLQIDGRFFRAGEDRIFLKCVTYGPFPQWWKEDHLTQLRQIHSIGFNAIRVYSRPTPTLLDAAAEVGLWVWVTLPWGWGTDFIRHGRYLSEARIRYSDFLSECGDHPALAGILVANEIPAEMVRWMGPVKVRQAIESLIDDCRSHKPDLLYAYGNYPTTEYLEPANADLTAFNVYLEQQEDFSSYLARLQAISGDRPVFITEIGLDSRRNDEAQQANLLEWQVESCLRAGIAGTTVYSWCDAWQNGKHEMTDWDFGLKTRDGKAKEALTRASTLLPSIGTPTTFLKNGPQPKFSIVVCTYNGAERIDTCLRSLSEIDYPNYEIIVVDDGSTDNTRDLVTQHDGIRLLTQEHLGLSEARNHGAKEAKGEIIAYTDDDCEADRDWLSWLATAFQDEAVTAAGGPNIPPPATGMQEALVAAAEGAPSHILFTDTTAEHLPGCNIAIRKDVLLRMGGFNPVFHAAGDDVDICWRLLDKGHTLAFVPSAFVWHRRRVSLWRYIQQQRGYGKAEKMLRNLHPSRFNRTGETEWSGVVYTGSTARIDDHSFIYHGLCGNAPYQSICTRMMPRRPIMARYKSAFTELLLTTTEFIARALRGWERSGALSINSLLTTKESRRKSYHEQLKRASEISKSGQTTPRGMSKVYSDDLRQKSEWSLWCEEGDGRHEALTALIKIGWSEIENDTDWDLIKGNVKILFATEHTDKKGTLTHVRIQHGSVTDGTIDELRRTLKQLK